MEMIVSFSRTVNQEKTGLAAAGVVFFLCAIVAAVGWVPLGIPSRIIRMLTPQITCVGLRPGSFDMYVCSAKVGLLIMIGPLILMVAVFLLRGYIAKALEKVNPKLPPDTRFLVAPLIATLIFTLAWTGSHLNTFWQSGLLPHTVFPAVVGLFTFCVARYGPAIQRALVDFFDFRDRYPVWLRFLVAILVPMLISLLITFQERVSEEAFKEQFVVIVALLLGYLAMAPRRGDLLSGVQQIMGREGRRL